MYSKIIERIETLRDEPARVHRVQRFNEALRALTLERGLSFRPKTTVLVAGTNGKGSVSKMVESLLVAPGRSVGLFTSPHMMDTTERIRSDGRDLTRDEFVRCFTTVEPFIEGLSHFEILTLMACEAFFGGRVRRAVDYSVIEVGVGGRLDPTRSIPHGTSVITKIGLDHEDLLGGTIDLIAREKFAIVDSGNAVIVSPLSEAARRAFEDRQRETEADYREVAEAKFEVDRRGPRPSWTLKSKWGDVSLSLKGARAAENANVALHVIEALGEDVKDRLPRLARVEWPCRMEGFEIDGREVYLSGDHNAQGAVSLVEIVNQFARRRVILVVGLGKNKGVNGFMETLSSIRGAEFVLTRTPFRGASLERFGSWLEKASTMNSDPQSALRHAIQSARPEDLVVVTGSLYLTGDLRRSIQSGHFGETKPIK